MGAAPVRQRSGIIQRLTGAARVSTDPWQIAKRVAYVVALGMSLLIFYLLSSLIQALDMLTP